MTLCLRFWFILILCHRNAARNEAEVSVKPAYCPFDGGFRPLWCYVTVSDSPPAQLKADYTWYIHRNGAKEKIEDVSESMLLVPATGGIYTCEAKYSHFSESANLSINVGRSIVVDACRLGPQSEFHVPLIPLKKSTRRVKETRIWPFFVSALILLAITLITFPAVMVMELKDERRKYKNNKRDDLSLSASFSIKSDSFTEESTKKENQDVNQ